MKHSVSSYMLSVAQGQTISFLKLLLSFCKDNRMNTDEISYLSN